MRFEVEAAGQRAINEAAKCCRREQVSLQTKMALLKVLPELIREAAKPLEAIDSIKIVQVDGLAAARRTARRRGRAGATSRRARWPRLCATGRRRRCIDGLMKELGFDGATLDNLIAGAAAGSATPRTEAPPASEGTLVTIEPIDKAAESEVSATHSQRVSRPPSGPPSRR